MYIPKGFKQISIKKGTHELEIDGFKISDIIFYRGGGISYQNNAPILSHFDNHTETYFSIVSIIVKTPIRYYDVNLSRKENFYIVTENWKGESAVLYLYDNVSESGVTLRYIGEEIFKSNLNVRIPTKRIEVNIRSIVYLNGAFPRNEELFHIILHIPLTTMSEEDSLKIAIETLENASTQFDPIYKGYNAFTNEYYAFEPELPAKDRFIIEEQKRAFEEEKRQHCGHVEEPFNISFKNF